MSKIHIAFEQSTAFIGFLTAGDPSLAKSEEFILKMVEGGADLIEIGIPFSDPIAEGPVIQNANIRALANGITIDGVFDLVAKVRTRTEVPIALLTYINPIFNYGYEDFFHQCNIRGVDGIIVPDLPYEEKWELVGCAENAGVDLISMIAPTSAGRIRKIAKEAKGFLYLVSSMGVTGTRSEMDVNLKDIIQTIKDVSDIPVAVGFGIHTPSQAGEIAKIADGVIVGSAIVSIIEKYQNDAASHLLNYIKTMKAAF